MKQFLIPFLIFAVFCSSCVSKKKYLACETARNELENVNIRQYKTIDTLKVEVQKKQKQIEALERDTNRKANQLSHTKNELLNVQNLLTSSKKELNERMQDLQQKDQSIKQIQWLYQNMSDSLRQYRLEIGTMLDSIIATDSSFKEVEIIEKEDQLVICMPEHFFFTGNNRNFISAKGKSMNQLLATLLHKHPSALARLTIYLPEAASNSAMKEPSDKASMRIASIYRSLHYENDIATERMQAGISANDPLSDKVCFTLFTGMKPIFETIKKL